MNSDEIGRLEDLAFLKWVREAKRKDLERNKKQARRWPMWKRVALFRALERTAVCTCDDEYPTDNAATCDVHGFHAVLDQGTILSSVACASVNAIKRARSNPLLANPLLIYQQTREGKTSSLRKKRHK